MAGFGRNVPLGRPYVLSEAICNLLFPGARFAAAVPAEVAAPLIEHIREATQPPQDVNIAAEVSAEVAAINLDLEPMNVEPDQEVGREVSEAGGASSLFNSSSSSSSFQGFQKSAYLEDRSRSTVPKVKTLKTKGLSKSSRPHKSNPVAPSKSRALSPVASTSKAAPPAKGSRSRAVKVSPPQPNFDPEAFADFLLQKLDKKVEARISDLSSQLASGLKPSDDHWKSLAERMQNQENVLSGFVRSGVAAQTYAVPDAYSLPPFDKGNPWRLALHAPRHEDTLTIEGLGTRRLEELEFFPPDLVPPYPGYARLTEEAWIRSGKVPKETVIFPRDQAQSALLRTHGVGGGEHQTDPLQRDLHYVLIA